MEEMENGAKEGPHRMHVSFFEPQSSEQHWNDEQKSEIEEMRAARQEQDHLIARLTEDNAHLETTVAVMENALCKLQAELRWSTQVFISTAKTDNLHIIFGIIGIRTIEN